MGKVFMIKQRRVTNFLKVKEQKVQYEMFEVHLSDTRRHQSLRTLEHPLPRALTPPPQRLICVDPCSQ